MVFSESDRILYTIFNLCHIQSPGRGGRYETRSCSRTDDGGFPAAIIVVDEDGTLLNETLCPARRVGFFFRDKTAINATDEALAILGLCCKWAMGDEGESSVEDLRKQIADFNLLDNYPNPFNPSTTITFFLPGSENVNLTVYNNMGSRSGRCCPEKFQKVTTPFNGMAEIPTMRTYPVVSTSTNSGHPGRFSGTKCY